MKKRYFLIEDFDSSLDLATSGIIALTPLAAYELGRRKIPYRILEDFYDERELRLGEDAFFSSQQIWVDSLERFLRPHIRFLASHELPVVSLHFNRLKYFVDSVVIQARILRSLLRRLEAGARVTYVRESSLPKLYTMEDFRFDDKSICFHELLPRAWAGRPDLHFDFHFAPSRDLSSPSGKNQPSLQENGTWPKPLSRLVKSFYLKWKHGSLCPGTFKEGENLPRVLFLHSGSPHLDGAIEKFIADGAEVWLKAGDEIYPLNGSWSKPLSLSSMELAEEEEIRADCERAAQAFENENQKLLNWVNHQCGMNVSSLLSPYFVSFFKDTCAFVLQNTIRFRHLYKSLDLLGVVSHTSSDSFSKSALLAAHSSGTEVKTFCIQHGCQVFKDETWVMTDLLPFDVYLASNSLSREIFKKDCETHSLTNLILGESPHYFLQFKKGVNVRVKSGKKQRVLYVPSKNVSLYARHYNWLGYPPVWFFEFQKELIRFFKEKSGQYDFIYKQAHPTLRFTEEAIVRLIQSEFKKEVAIDTRPMFQCFREIDKVVLDRPTTAFFESIACGLPTLALYPDFVEDRLLPEMKAYFGKSLQPFSSFLQATKKLEEFLSDSPQEYLHELPLKDNFSFEQILTEEKKCQLLAV